MSKLIRFAFVGLAMTLLNYLLFIAAMRCSLGYLIAAAAAWLLTVLVGYALNRRFTFKQSGWGGARDVAGYIAGYGMQFVISLVSLSLLVGLLHLGPSVAYGINLVLTASFSFCYLRFAVFRTPPAPAVA